MSKQGRIFVLNEPVALRISPALAEEIGLNESIVLLQIEFWISISNHVIDGRRWTYQSIRDMKEKAFPFWSKDTINRAITSLINKGLLIEGNFNEKKYDKTRWLALGDGIKNLQSIRFVEGFEIRSTQNETRSSQNETPIPEITTEITTENIYSHIASENENEDLFGEETEEQNASKGRAKAVPYNEIVDLYNELCPSLPSVKKLTDKRKRNLKTLWEFIKGDMEHIRTVFENAEDSDFLSGRNEKWTGCNFDWLININNFVKVLEGSYNDRSKLRRMPGDDAFGIKAYLRREQEELERSSKNKDPAGVKAYLRKHGYDSILAEVEAKEREEAG